MTKSFLLNSILIVMLISTGAHCTELKEAMDKAIINSIKLKAHTYALQGAKKQLRMNGLAGFLPFVTYDFQITSVSKSGANQVQINDDYTSKIGQLSVNQKVIDGGERFAALSQAKYQIEAERLDLFQTRQKILLNAINAYVRVLTAIEVQNLSQHNENALKQHLLIAQKRFSVGEVTKTDVAQAEARLASMISEKIRAEGNLKIANASYVHAVGEEPKDLLQPTDLPAVPGSLEECLELAKKNNLTLKSESYKQKIAAQAIIAARSKALPFIDLSAQVKNTIEPASTREHNVSLNISVPIFQRGVNFAAIDQANIAAKQYMYSYYETIKNIEEAVITYWENVSTVHSVLDSSKEAVKAAEVVVDGIKQEAELNLRTTVDVLDAERELFRAKVSLVEAESNYVTSIYNLLSLIGDLNII